MDSNKKRGRKPNPEREILEKAMDKAGLNTAEQAEVTNEKPVNEQGFTEPSATPAVAAPQVIQLIEPAVTRDDVVKAIETLMKYKDGKRNLESRIVEDEEWYKLNHWSVIRKGRRAANPAEQRPEPTSAWLFNTILNKHADAMDNYPEPNVLPRERGDEQDAQALSSILPVIMENTDFERTYSNNWWEKLKHGTAAYGVFWNAERDNGLGDIDIRMIDLLNLFWEPGVSNIQDSRNLFIVDLRDNDLLEQEYPILKGKLKSGGGGQLAGNVVDIRQYIYDDDVDVSEKSVVVDWYYKVKRPGGRTVLQYAKFVGDTLLYASENTPEYYVRGWYDHGKYPVVLDSMFPEKGTPIGFGYIAITKDPQMYIDKLGQNILENAMMATKPRYFAGMNTGINEEEFLDWSKPIVHVEGSINEERLRPISVSPLSGVYLNVMNMKISELKETAANRDFSNGGASSGVTAAAAIAALQEAGNKASRDMISEAYRSYTDISYLCIELIRQFYSQARSFRITGGSVQGARSLDGWSFIEYSNERLGGLPIGISDGMTGGYTIPRRRPVFDIRIKAQKRNPYSRMSQNELARQLYAMGFFAPEKAQEALAALELMEFEGKEQVIRRISGNRTLEDIIVEQKRQLDKMAFAIQLTTGRDMGIPAAKTAEIAGLVSGNGESQPPQSGGGQIESQSESPIDSPRESIGQKVVRAQLETQKPYAERIADRSAEGLQ